MLHELEDDRIEEFNRVNMCESTNQTNYLVQLQKFTGIYQAMPPIISTAIGYAIMHPEINLNGLDLAPYQKEWNKTCFHGGMHAEIDTNNDRDPDDCYMWNAEHGKAFAHAFGPPLLGYLVGFILWNSIHILACTTKHEQSFNKESNSCDRMAWNIVFTQSKLSCPPSGTVANALATTFWSSATTVGYALLGAAIVGSIPDKDAAVDLAATHAIGGAVIPGLVTSAYIIGRIFAYAEIKWCPPAGFYKFNLPTCHTLKNIPILPMLCSANYASRDNTTIAREEIQAAIPIDLNALLDSRNIQPSGPMLFSVTQVHSGFERQQQQQQQQQHQTENTNRMSNCVIS